jgi:hypothetical protein
MDLSDNDVMLLAALAAHIAAAAAMLVSMDEEPIPYHTSALSGLDWVIALLEGHPERIRSELGVHKEVFKQLICHLQDSGIQSTRNVLIEEQLAIFLYTCVTGLSFHHVGEQFQRSTSTISM